MFIDHDGRWFFSLGYTIANLAVQAGVVDQPDYGAWRRVLADESAGGDTPSEAIARVINAAPQLDLEEAMQAIDPIETKLLHDFLPLILGDLDAPRADVLREGRIEILDLELSEEIDGDSARVFIDLIRIRASEDGGDALTLEFDGDWCYGVDGDSGRQLGCLDRDLGGLQDTLGDQLEESGLEIDLGLRELLPERPFLLANRHNSNTYFSPFGAVLGYSADLEDLVANAAGQLEGGRLAAGGGTLLVDSIAFDSTAMVKVLFNSSNGLAIMVGPDDFNNADGFELAMAAVTFSTTERIEIQHKVENSFSDGPNSVRVRPGSPTTLIVSGEPGFPQGSAVVLHNTSDESVMVTVTVTRLPFEELAPGESISGVIDDAGTPWLFSTLDTVDVDGAAVVALEFDRFPWFEIGRNDPDAAGVIVVVGEPDAVFTVNAN